MKLSDVYEFDTVALDSSGSFDPKSRKLSYEWVQTAGTSVVLTDDQAVKPTFDAPNVDAGGEILTFKVTVTDADNLEATDTVNVNVLNDTCPGDFDDDNDVDGKDLAEYVIEYGGLDLAMFAANLGNTNCP